MTDDDHPLEDITIKELLAEQNALLRGIYQTTVDESATDETPMGRCERCGDIVPWDERRSHAESRHNWHESMGVETLPFEQI